MPYFKSSTEWYEQSSLLLKARPSTVRSTNTTLPHSRLIPQQARVTSKYTVLKPTSSKVKKREKYAAKRSQQTTSTTEGTSPAPTTSPQDTEAPTATFTLKTYDPESGVCLQYETNKAAEVGRLITTLGRLGKHMAAMKEITTDFTMPAGNAGIETPGVESDVQMADAPPQKPAAGGNAGGKKKKKGKK
jgi:hypothetical protein